MFNNDSGKAKGRGGARPGAGRPSTDSKLFTLRLPKDIARHVDSLPNKTDYIKSCIIHDINQRKAVGAFRQIGEAYPVERIKDLTLPLFDIEVVAGFPIPLDNDERSQDIELLQVLCPHPESCYLIRVTGDSMIDANIHPGDIIIVDKDNRNPGPNEVAMCELNGEYTIKYFVREEGHGWLVPANPDYPKIKITPSDDFHVWGVVTYIIHKPIGERSSQLGVRS